MLCTWGGNAVVVCDIMLEYLQREPGGGCGDVRLVCFFAVVTMQSGSIWWPLYCWYQCTDSPMFFWRVIIEMSHRGRSIFTWLWSFLAMQNYIGIQGFFEKPNKKSNQLILFDFWLAISSILQKLLIWLAKFYGPLHFHVNRVIKSEESTREVCHFVRTWHWEAIWQFKD